VLKALPLTSLTANGCTPLDDLTLLKGKPMTDLEIFDTGVTDLTPMEGMPLERVYFDPHKITRGMEVLNPRKMSTLRTLRIGAREIPSPAEFWGRYAAGEFK